MRFLENKYSKWYYCIIEKRLCANENLGYTESHHIVPESLGGSNRKENKVRLTPREHFVCHWLLTKMVIGKDLLKMSFAFHSMTTTGPIRSGLKVSSRKFSIAKKNCYQHR